MLFMCCSLINLKNKDYDYLSEHEEEIIEEFKNVYLGNIFTVLELDNDFETISKSAASVFDNGDLRHDILEDCSYIYDLAYDNENDYSKEILVEWEPIIEYTKEQLDIMDENDELDKNFYFDLEVKVTNISFM